MYDNDNHNRELIKVINKLTVIVKNGFALLANVILLMAVFVSNSLQVTPNNNIFIELFDKFFIPLVSLSLILYFLKIRD